MSYLPQGSTPQTSSFTCNTCGIKFVTADLQRQHMKTDWHRYNLKRRVASLPSISSDVFAEKILSQQQVEEGSDDEEDEFGFFIQRRHRSTNGKQPTKKSLKQQARFDALKRGRGLLGQNAILIRTESPANSVVSEFSEFSLGDSTHLTTDNESTGSELNYSATDSEFTDLDHSHDEEIDSEDETGSDSELDELEILPITTCFFCGKNNKEIENNVKHMFNNHGLYIPERSYLVDLEGLLTYLSEIFTYENECLVCGFEGKNLESIRQHIYNKGHCKIPYETKEEKAFISQYYNFSVDKREKKKSSEKKVAFAESQDDDDEVIVDLKTDESSEQDEDEEGDDYADNYSVVHVDRSGVELTLPNGSKLGHRSMTRYYRQNLPAPRDALDGEKTVSVVDKRFAPGITTKEITKQEKQTRLLEQRANNHDIRKDGRRTNYQKHFRDEILGT